MPRSDITSRGINETSVLSAARTASGNSGVIGGWGYVSTIRAQLDIVAASGTTPNIVVTVEDTLDDTNWNTVGTFAAATTAGREVINITAPFSEKIRFSWAITGTAPSFTFSINVYSE